LRADSRRVRWAGAFVLFAGLGLGGCKSLLPAKGRVTEFRSSTAPHVTYSTIAVIANDDTPNTIKMSATVRSTLTKDGWNAIRATGRWSSEEEAMLEICNPNAATPAQGLLIVSFDTLHLRECKSKLTAYKINGGGRLSLPELTERLERFLKTSAQG
jgi:hypothetical protein